jgi:type IV secretion system protein VirB10
MTTESVLPNYAARPMVARQVSNSPAWIFGGVVVIAAIGLFSALEARRADQLSPATSVPINLDGRTITSPPPLTLPTLDIGESEFAASQSALLTPRVPVPATPVMVGTVPARPAALPRAPAARLPAYYDSDSPDAQYIPPVSQPVLAARPEPLPAPQANGQLTGNRVNATRLVNPANTVPQGAVIQAVLETALDSNRPGFARAIVSRDVRSFDGSRVLIPRGSRLFGEYKADLAQGQKRAFVNWLKLTRPDGVQIAIESPAADPLGRAGLGGKVNSHFFERFSGAILQSVLDIGVAVASRKATGDTVVVGLPGSTQTLINPNIEAIKPTLSVKHGSGVTVFVARDLDFSGLD